MNRDLMTALAAEFHNNLKVLKAIGDETRQAIMVALIHGPQKRGMRVNEIRAITHLSRPTVSHHLKVLKEAGIISISQEGAHYYYRLDAGSKLKQMKSLVSTMEKVLSQCEGDNDESASPTKGNGERE